MEKYSTNNSKINFTGPDDHIIPEVIEQKSLDLESMASRVYF